MNTQLQDATSLLRALTNSPVGETFRKSLTDADRARFTALASDLRGTIARDEYKKLTGEDLECKTHPECAGTGRGGCIHHRAKITGVEQSMRAHERYQHRHGSTVQDDGQHHFSAVDEAHQQADAGLRDHPGDDYLVGGDTTPPKAKATAHPELDQVPDSVQKATDKVNEAAERASLTSVTDWDDQAQVDAFQKGNEDYQAACKELYDAQTEAGIDPRKVRHDARKEFNDYAEEHTHWEKTKKGQDLYDAKVSSEQIVEYGDTAAQAKKTERQLRSGARTYVRKLSDYQLVQQQSSNDPNVKQAAEAEIMRRMGLRASDLNRAPKTDVGKMRRMQRVERETAAAKKSMEPTFTIPVAELRALGVEV